MHKHFSASKKFLFAGLALILFFGAASMVQSAKKGEVREFKSVVVIYEGSKMWVPSTFVVNKGDTVKFELLNNVPDGSDHGFAINEYKIAETVKKGAPSHVEFVTNKAGIFRIFCQLHPAHVGGQLVVLP